MFQNGQFEVTCKIQTLYEIYLVKQSRTTVQRIVQHYTAEKSSNTPSASVLYLFLPTTFTPKDPSKSAACQRDWQALSAVHLLPVPNNKMHLKRKKSHRSERSHTLHLFHQYCRVGMTGQIHQFDLHCTFQGAYNCICNPREK